VRTSRYSASQLAQTTLRSVLGKRELDELLAERDRLNADIPRTAGDAATLFRGPSRHRERAVLNHRLSAADGSAHPSRPTTGRGEVTLIRSDFDHGWEWRTGQNKNANAYTIEISI
jgi:regulator of protease activity HflC (stomatin/prohibitin superfamily)